ncbi:MAG: pilin [Legionellales bacterium]|nr:pilin [Legionellales bacterium]
MTEALAAGAMGKTAVTEATQSVGSIPADNAAAGLGSPASYASTNLTSLTITAGSVILLLPNTDALGNLPAFTITLTPSAYVVGTSLQWTCSTLPVAAWIYVPESCRN